MTSASDKSISWAEYALDLSSGTQKMRGDSEMGDAKGDENMCGKG